MKIKSEFLLLASLSAEKVSEIACKVFGKKKQEQVLMFAKFEAEKISSTEFQGILKEQKKILRFAKLITEKGSSDYFHASEKAKSKRTEEMELA